MREMFRVGDTITNGVETYVVKAFRNGRVVLVDELTGNEVLKHTNSLAMYGKVGL